MRYVVPLSFPLYGSILKYNVRSEIGILLVKKLTELTLIAYYFISYQDVTGKFEGNCPT